ncbi:MAG: GNAT family N-acetyltransferase [Paludibacteraceae bacterium]|nr:GNAT family N-acetyltransferase [Paludibacteraceae bacterium]
MTAKEQYAEWCKDQPAMPIFMQPWWLDAVCAGKGWNVLLYIHPRSERILAALPYLTGKRWWMHFVLMPQQTQIGGIWLDHSLLNADGSTWDKETLQTICQYFFDQLLSLRLHYYYQRYAIGNPCPAILQQLGMKTRERYTYRIEDLTDLDKVVARFSNNKKRQLTKALSLHAERGKMNVEDFYRFHRDCLAARRKTISYSREFLLVLERKARRLNCGEIVSIHNADGQVYAAAFVVWDNRTLYYLIPAFDSAYSHSGASALLVLECIKLAREKGVAFDFEGSMIRGVAKHYKQFGSERVTYYEVEKFYRPLFAIPYWCYQLLTSNRR